MGELRREKPSDWDALARQFAVELFGFDAHLVGDLASLERPRHAGNLSPALDDQHPAVHLGGPGVASGAVNLQSPPLGWPAGPGG